MTKFECRKLLEDKASVQCCGFEGPLETSHVVVTAAELCYSTGHSRPHASRQGRTGGPTHQAVTYNLCRNIIAIITKLLWSYVTANGGFERDVVKQIRHGSKT